MKKQAKPSWGAASVAILALGAVLTCLPMNSAYAKKPTRCNDDAVKQSVCIYQAILADVDKTYPMRGGGGIGSIAETSTRKYKVRIFQEGHTDHVDYTVRIGAGGKVEIVDKKESTESHGPPHTPLEFPMSWSWAIAPIYHIFFPPSTFPFRHSRVFLAGILRLL
ncbi:MAG: hypothetical protein LBE22_04770 [Azoarcus sp.]|jgi:hypothetical protein|nr:hypothetical protein [Azoarcus sp.]